MRVTPPASASGTTARAATADLSGPAGAPRAAARRRPTRSARLVHLALRALFERPPAERTASAAAALVDRYWSSEGFRDDRQAAA